MSRASQPRRAALVRDPSHARQQRPSCGQLNLGSWAHGRHPQFHRERTSWRGIRTLMELTRER